MNVLLAGGDEWIFGRAFMEGAFLKTAKMPYPPGFSFPEPFFLFAFIAGKG